MTEESSISADGPRAVLVELICKALRAEAGIRYQQEVKRSTSYYSGRRSGLTVSAALLVSQLYAVDLEAARKVISERVRLAGDEFSTSDLIKSSFAEPLAVEIAVAALLAE